MENIFTPEEANKPVTYGDLLTILTSVNQDLCEHAINYADGLQEQTFKIIDKITDHIVAIRDDAEYDRQRDIRFMINLIAQIGGYDMNVLNSEYNRWCEEFDKLNKPKTSEEKKDE